MTLHKSYLYMAAKAIHRLNDKNLGVTIPEIHRALTREYETVAHIELDKFLSAVHHGVSKGKIVCEDRVVFHLGGTTKVSNYSGPPLTQQNSFEVKEGHVWWIEDDTI